MNHLVTKLLGKIFVLVIFLNFVSLPIVAKAAGGEALMISPLITEEVVQPGEVLTKSIHVTNESSTARKIYPIIRDFVSDGEDGTPRLIVPGSQTGSFVSDWLHIPEDGVLMQPGSSHDFTFSINVPQNAGPGGYYGALVFGTKAEDVRLNTPDKGAASAISQQAASLILVKIPGGAVEKAEIKDFTTDHGFYGTPFKTNFLVRLENTGNVHVNPRGVIRIFNMFDKEVTTVKVNDKGGNILPKSLRKFQATWQDKFGFGRYRAELALSYGTSPDVGGNGKQSLAETVYFWIMPWKIIIPVLVGILLILILSYLSLKSMKNRAVKKALKNAGGGTVRAHRVAQGHVSNRHLNLMMFAIMALFFILILAVLLLLFA